MMISKTSNQGFTLVEVAIVLLIGGMILGFVTSSLLSYIKNTQIRATETKLEAIDEALQLFLSLNGRLPCPAPLNAAPDTANFGIELSDTNCAGQPVNPGETFQSAGVRIGALPVRTLNIPDDYMGDSWGNRFTYAVTEVLADATTYDQTLGAISVVDSTEPPDPVLDSVINPPGSGHYVVISHGPNSSGGFTLANGADLGCPAGNLEEENCDDDNVFRSTILAGSANNANLYDDLIKIRSNTVGIIPTGAVMAFNLAACPPGWNDFAAAEDRVIVGSRINPGGDYDLGDTGGSEDHILTLGEAGISLLSITAVPGPTNIAQLVGGSNPHENMPRYIALRYCQKS